MRIFEVVLVLANLVTLCSSFKKQSKAALLGLAGVNIVILLVHGLLNGFRYQMIFSYGFVVLFAAYVLIKINDKFFEARTPTILKIIGVSLSCLLLGFTFFLAYALPVFTFSKPTGIYAIGIQYFHLTDENRTEPFLDKSTEKRELMVKVYYPAKNDDSKPYSPYFHSPELIRLFTAGYGLPDFMFDHLNLVKTNSKEGLQISEDQPNYPVILFSHGAGTSMETQTSNCEDLASHGYIVVSIDYPYVSAATIFPDRVVSAREATKDFKMAEPAEAITQIMAEDAGFVIDTLGKINEGKIVSIFAGKLNMEKIGAIGHSVGGAVAYNLAINNSRVKAAIDLDGVVFITPKDSANHMAPFLMLANDKFHIQALQKRENLMKKFEEMTSMEQEETISIYGSKEVYQDTYNKAQQNLLGLTDVLKTSGNLFTIEGSDHMKFIDIGLFIGISQLRELISIGGKTDPAKCLEITEAVSVAFFDQHLKEGSQDSWVSLIQKYPELKRVDLQ